MKISISFICGLLLIIAACAPQAELVKTRSELSDLRQDVKTAEERVQELQKSTNQDILKRLDTSEKRLNAAEAEIQSSMDVQKSMADYGARADQLATDIQLLQGRLEENNFRIAEMGQKLDDRNFKISELSGRIDELEAKLKSLAAGQGVESAQSGTAAKKSAPIAIEPSEAYRRALNDYNGGNYDLALEGFQNYLSRYPEASLADKAQYWIGECHYAKKDFDDAIEAFSKVVKSYPKSDKVPGAKLKIAYSYFNHRNNSKAKQWLNQVIKDYPRSKEAELAKEKLRKIEKK